jgi:hypothetical protein
MATELYLDTARLGRMCRSACSAERDFTMLARQLGSSLYWRQFLSEGCDALSEPLKRQLPGLQSWHGVAALRRSLGKFVGLPDGGHTLLAGQSASLVTMAAHQLFDRCGAVVTTDLEWPAYLVLLKRIAVARGKRLCVARIRHRVLKDQIDAFEIVEGVERHYRDQSCDGYFLSDVSSLGVRMPLRRIVAALQTTRTPLYGVVDGAQALAHLPINFGELPADIYLTGAHKWLGGYFPLRIAFIKQNGKEEITHLLRRLLARQLIIDPLCEFLDAVENDINLRFGETVNLSALFSAAGAIAEWNADPMKIERRYRIRRANCRRVERAIAPYATPIIHKTLRAGIVLVTTGLGSDFSLHLAATHGVSLSMPLPGMMRLAMPERRLQRPELSRLQALFRDATTSRTDEPAPYAFASGQVTGSPFMPAFHTH